MKNKSWKTTISGILSVVPAILHLIFPLVITSDTALALTSIIVGSGLASAKDHNVTGN